MATVTITRELTGAWETWVYQVPDGTSPEEALSGIESGEVSGDLADSGYESESMGDVDYGDLA